MNPASPAVGPGGGGAALGIGTGAGVAGAMAFTAGCSGRTISALTHWASTVSGVSAS